MAGIRDAFTGSRRRFFRCHPKIFVYFAVSFSVLATGHSAIYAQGKSPTKGSARKIGELLSKQSPDRPMGASAPGNDVDTPEQKALDQAAEAAKDKKSSEKDDVLSLLDAGKISIKLQADGAYKLHIKIRNETDKPQDVTFPPGLVADAFAQNQLYYQVGDGEAGQGLGLLNTPKSTLTAGGEASFNVRSCCLNYGVPEPRRNTPLFLKSIQDYTPNPEVHRVLKAAAAAKVSTPVAQAALWHYTNNLSWEKLAKVGPGVGLVLNQDQMKEAKFLSGETTTAAATELAKIPLQPEIKQPTEKMKPVAISINPDPRSIQASGTAVRQLVHAFRQAAPSLDISYRNFSATPPAHQTPVVQWHVLVKAFETNNSGVKKPALFTIQRSEWDPRSTQWKHDKPYVAKAPKSHNDETPAVLVQRLMSDIAERSLQLTYNKVKGEVRIVNSLPVEVTAVSIRSKKQDDSGVVLKEVSVPPGVKGVVVKLSAEDQQKLSTGKPSAYGFEIRS